MVVGMMTAIPSKRWLAVISLVVATTTHPGGPSLRETRGRAVGTTITVLTVPLRLRVDDVIIGGVSLVCLRGFHSTYRETGRRDYSSSGSESPPPRKEKERRKSLTEQALAAITGGGAALAAAQSGRSKSHGRGEDDRRRGRRDSSSDRSRSRDRSRGRDKKNNPFESKEKLIQAARAAVTAGAVEAFRMRKEPGGWGGEKGKRVLTAAIGAGGINGLIDKDPDKGGTRHTIEAVIGGLAGNRLLNGSRSEAESRSRSRGRGRDDSRDRGGSGFKDLATGGLAAAAAKAFADRNKSKERGRRRGYSSSSEDSRDAGRGRRSKSVSDYMRQGMGALGIGGNKNQRVDNRSREISRGVSDSSPSPPRTRGGVGLKGSGVQDQQLQRVNQNHQVQPLKRSGSQSSSTSDLTSSSGEEREAKKMKRKQILTTGLASVATIHAAHSVYQSYEKRKERQKELAKGEITPKEARKRKNKGLLQDAASVGIAALGIKGAYSEWKETREMREEAHEFREKMKEHHERRIKHQLEAAHEYGEHHGFGDQPHGYSPEHEPPPYGADPHSYAPNPAQATHPDMYQQNAYRASAPDLPSGYYPEPPGAQQGGYYPNPPYAGQPGAPRHDSPSIAHYSDGNPYHTAGVPLSPQQQ